MLTTWFHTEILPLRPSKTPPSLAGREIPHSENRYFPTYSCLIHNVIQSQLWDMASVVYPWLHTTLLKKPKIVTLQICSSDK